MKFLKTKILAVIFFLIGIFYLGVYDSVYAKASTDADTLHKTTKIYSSNNDDYFSGCEDYSNYVESCPTITVLTHGLGSSASYFSNQKGVSNDDFISYNGASIVAKMFDNLQGNLDVYVAKCATSLNNDKYVYNFTLHKYSDDDYVNNNIHGTETAIIDNTENHILIIFDSDIPNESNEDVYDEFHNLLDNISLQYKKLTGVLPRFNLVGHSRGGLTNIRYAADHIYNVSSVYSMGTPYNGSALGELDIVLGFMGYADENYEITNNGVYSILDDEDTKKIRDLWNEAYTADANVNVVALGAMASIDLVDQMIFDIANDPSYKDYNSMISNYVDLIDSVMNFINTAPNFTSSTINFVNGFAEVINNFGLDIYDEIFTGIDANLEGKITYEEVDRVLSLFNVINNELVIMDDLFIDTDSQLGMGFSDDISYNGFKRYVKIFDETDYTSNRAIPDQPGVVHNLEPFNDDYTDLIVGSLVYGVGSENITLLTDGFSSVTNFNNGKAYSFNPTATGKRTFYALECTILVYKYNPNGGLELVCDSYGNASYTYQKGEKYIIVATSSSTKNVSVSFILNDKLVVGSNSVTINGSDLVVKLVTASTSGYYIIDTSSTVSITNATKISTTKYYVRLTVGQSMYIYIRNNSTSAVTANIKFSEPSEVELDSNNLIGTSNIVQKFTNPYDVTMSFTLNLKWTGTAKRAYVYTQNGEALGSVTSSSTSYVRTFTLSANQACYIVYSTSDSTITSNLKVSESQYRWRVEGVLYSTTNLILPRGNDYSIEFVYYVNGTVIETDTSITYASSTYFDYAGDLLSISSTALIGYDIVLFPDVAPKFLLTVTVGYNNELTYSISNDNSVTLTYNTNDKDCDSIEFRIYNSTYGNQYLTLNETYGTVDITPYLGTANSYTYVYVNKVVINSVTFTNYTNCLSISEKSVHNLYNSGSGTSNSPYTIANQRHLDNIRLNTSKYYSIESNINLSGTWTPINFFYGEIIGNYYNIYYLDINANVEGNDYGFINYNYGTLENINFRNSDISTTLKSNSIRMSIGVVCGYNYGTLDNCNTYYSNIDLVLPYVFVGDICGSNSGYIYDSDSYYLDMEASHLAGGVCGFNYGTLEYSYASSAKIIYNHISYNGRVGGVVGENHSSGEVIDCRSSGNLYWDSPSRNSDISPCIGKLIGSNYGSYSDCSSSMGYSFHYYYWYFIGYFDQGVNLVAADDGLVGYQS